MINIGFLAYIPRHGGGTYQLTENVMCALRDYAEARSNVRIHCFHGPLQSEELRRMGLKFPGFQFHEIGLAARVCSAVLRRAFVKLPYAISLLRYLHPLNWLAGRQRTNLLIFPGSAVEACFYRGKQWFLFTDIAHVFHPHFPELAADGELRRRNSIFRYGVRYASQIVVESEQLRSDIVKYFGADPSRVAILHQTVSQTLEALGTVPEDAESLQFKRSLPERFLFYPAQLWAHKNHVNLLHALKILSVSYPDLHLILVGTRQPGDQRIFDLIAELGLEEKVRWMGYVPDKFMPVLYRNARALVKPGYVGPTNIPTLEAFFYGCPAVITGLPGVREQTADAALLFDPDSPQDIADKVRMVLDDKAIRDDLVMKGYERLRLLGYDSYKKTFFFIVEANLAGASIGGAVPATPHARPSGV